jgi:hypothetical protein
MFTIKRRIIAIVALGLLALSSVLPASATHYASLSYAYCSGYGATNVYATYLASDTQGTNGCWKWLTARRFDSGQYVQYYLNFGYASSYTTSYPSPQPGWATHGLGIDDWENDWDDTLDTPDS